MQTTPKRMIVDLIGKFFILPPLSYAKKKDVPVDRAHPLLQILLLQMRLQHIHQFHGVHFFGRANLMCSGT